MASFRTVVGELGALITKELELVNEVTSSLAWDSPTRTSPAGNELVEEESLPDRTLGSWPWLSGPMIARWALQLAAAEAEGFSAVLDLGTTSYAADVLCRSVLESTALTWWLLEPDIGSQKRVARALAYRLSSANETAKAVKHLGLPVEGDWSGYGELPDDVKKEIQQLGLSCTRGPGGRPRCGGEVLPSYTERIADLVGQVWPQPKLPYAMLSQVAHAELVGLARSSPRVSGSEAVPDPPIESNRGLWMWYDAYLVLGTLTFSAHRAASFLGLHKQVNVLWDWMGESQRALLTARPMSPAGAS